jgi:predicted RNA-binding protein YlxR (DUF448 family)
MTMPKKTEPLRTCIGCREKRGQGEMTRLALVEGENGLKVHKDAGRSLGGRGAWLCRDSEACLALAVKKRAFGRAFKISDRPFSITIEPNGTKL